MASRIRSLATGAVTTAAKHARDRPYMTGFQALTVCLTPILGPDWIAKPVLGVIGFGPSGPIAGSLAAWYQSSFLGAYIPANSLFAAAQRFTMG